MSKRLLGLVLLAVLVAGCGSQQRKAAEVAPVWCPSKVVRVAAVWPREAREIRRSLAGAGTSTVRQVLQPQLRFLERQASFRRFNARRLVGWQATNAEKYVRSRGCEWRVVMRNGVNLIITDDLRPNRVDFDIRHRRVTGVAVY